MKHRFAKLATMVFAVALAACILPTAAFASPYVNVHYDGDTTQVDLGSLTKVATADNPRGYLFQKNDQWNVVGTNNAVTLSSVLSAGGATGSYSYLIFATTDFPGDYPNGYNKYSPFSYAKMTGNDYFYGNTTVSTLVTPYTSVYAGGAVLALETSSTVLSGTQTAQQAVNAMTFNTNDAPRLLWGFKSSTGADSDVGGNRFPSMVTDIYVH